MSGYDDMLPTLAISGSNPAASHAFSAAIRTHDGVAVELPRPGERGDLATLVQRACASAGIPLSAIRSVRIDRGPGSYIGLRVAVTFARTLCTFEQLPLGITDTLQVIAAAALTADPQRSARRLVTVLDGRQGRVHLGIYQLAPGGQLATTLAPCAIAESELAAALRPGDAILATQALAPRLVAVTTAAQAEWHEIPSVHAGSLFAPALSFTTATLAELEPLYLMGSYVG
jgi:tRNA threonylcarbamoyladenosine biosynthesis protein TsaB